MDLYFQGLARLNRGLTPDIIAEARDFFDRALAADPGNIDALVASAAADAISGIFLFSAAPGSALSAAELKLNKALSAAPDHARCHLTLGILYLHTKRAAAGIAECEHALALNQNLAAAHGFAGLGKILTGRANETEAEIVEAMRLSPRDPQAYIWLKFAGDAKGVLELHDEELIWRTRSIEANRNFPLSYFSMAALLAQLNRLEEARKAFEAGLALDPNFSIARLNAFTSAISDDPKYLAWHARSVQALRKIGVPE